MFELSEDCPGKNATGEFTCQKFKDQQNSCRPCYLASMLAHANQPKQIYRRWRKGGYSQQAFGIIAPQVVEKWLK